MTKIPCFLCSKKLQRRTDKNAKPYFICNPCGTQIFIRGEQGIENLNELIATLRERDFPFREHARVLHEIQAVLTEIRGIKKELDSLDSIFNFFSDDEHKERTRKLLNTRIETLLSQLDEIAHKRNIERHSDKH